MDLTTYTGLKDAIAQFLNRDDLVLQIPGFIALAEAEIRRRVRRKTIRATVNFAAETVTLPADCAQLRSVRLISGSPTRDVPIGIVTMEQLAESRARHAAVAGRPQQASVVGTQLILVPAPDQTYSADITYFEKLTPLSGSVATNSVLAEAPDLYLYGPLKHAAPYLEHDERIPIWQGFFDDGVTQLDTARMNEETGASLRPARLPIVIG